MPTSWHMKSLFWQRKNFTYLYFTYLYFTYFFFFFFLFRSYEALANAFAL